MEEEKELTSSGSDDSGQEVLENNQAESETVQEIAEPIIEEVQPEEQVAENESVASDEIIAEDAFISEEIPSEPEFEVEVIETENIEEPKAPEAKKEEDKKIKINTNTVIIVIIVLAVVLGIIFLLSKKSDRDEKSESNVSVSVDGRQEQGKISIIEETKDDIKVLTASNDRIAWPKTKVIAYFGNTQKNPNSADCSLTYLLEREIDKRYDSNMLNSVLAVLEPLKNIEKEKGYVSSIPEGSSLKYIKLDDSGVATVNFSGNLNKAAGSCAVTAIKSQIKDTLLQFASVKSVVICIDDNCQEDEILQP